MTQLASPKNPWAFRAEIPTPPDQTTRSSTRCLGISPPEKAGTGRDGSSGLIFCHLILLTEVTGFMLSKLSFGWIPNGWSNVSELIDTPFVLFSCFFQPLEPKMKTHHISASTKDRGCSKQTTRSWAEAVLKSGGAFVTKHVRTAMLPGHLCSWVDREASGVGRAFVDNVCLWHLLIYDRIGDSEISGIGFYVYEISWTISDDFSGFKHYTWLLKWLCNDPLKTPPGRKRNRPR